MKTRHLLFLSLFLMLTLVSCQNQEDPAVEESASIDDYADSVESTINMVSGALDDSSNESIAQNKSILNFSLINQAYAAACNRNLSNNGGGVCVRNVNCEYSTFVWSGSIVLEFANQNHCFLTGSNDSFLRKAEFSRSGYRGTLKTSTTNKQTYDNTTVGGGIQVTQIDNAGNIEIDILGQNKTLSNNNGRVIFDMSVKSFSPLLVNKLARSGRVILSGVTDVYHNKWKFRAENTFSNVTYQASCCYPVSGSISTTLSGSLNGTGSVQFNGCGKMTITYGQTTRTYSLANCE